ncbi:uncharacterized protein [Branchiostoma lanceolatum]|uniref:uncharacterized protein n=1 Tax=Branchiostoma lanceolatum TaxID=7740 RepID=UPI003456349A
MSRKRRNIPVRGLYSLPSDPLTLEQKLLFHRYRRELITELFTAPPSRLFHYLIGKGALTLPDVRVIKADKLKETAVNKAFLKRIAAKGERGYLAFCDGLRSRHGAWQGYLAELLDGHVMSMVGDDFLQLLKVVSLNIVQYLPQGWTRLVRLLGVTPRELETCKRQNKLRTHQVLHALTLWVGARVDQDDLITQLLSALKRIRCGKVADLVQSLYADLKQKYQDEEEAERVIRQLEEDRELDQDLGYKGEGGEQPRVGEGEIQPCVRYSYGSTYFSSRGMNPTRDLQENRRNRREKLRTIEAATHAEEMGKLLYRPESGKLSDRRSSDGDSGLGRERDVSSRASSSARSLRDGAESRASTSEGRMSSPNGSDPVVSGNTSPPAKISPEAVSLLKLGNIQEQEEDEHEEKLALNMGA